MSLFSAVVDFLKPEPPPSPAVSRAMESVGELISPILRSTPGFEKKLSHPLEYALGYCDGLVAALPGPIDINRQAFSNDPLVHALFATAGDIEQMLGRSESVRDFLASPAGLEHEHFYALFAARRQEKKQLGIVQHGDVIQNDVPQRVIYFSAQALIEPDGDLAITRDKLRTKALESLLHTFNTHIEALRNEREGLRADASVERAHLMVMKGASAGQNIAVHTRHLQELDTRLRESVASLMPDEMLNALGTFLHNPEQALHLKPCTVTIDRLGVVCDPVPDDANIHTLNFPELTARDNRLHIALLARISRDEALEAVETVRDQQYRFMLI